MADNKSMASKYNSSISACRVIGMLMIITCHIGTALGSAAIGQLFQSGVQLFLFISGFLYSNKSLGNSRKWIYGRILRVSVPCYIWVLLMCASCLLLKQTVSVWTVVLSALNLQGLHFLITFLPRPVIIQGASHLWFITALMLCYLLTIPMKYLERKGEKKSEDGMFLWGMLLMSCLLGMVGIRMDVLWIYFAGYVAGKKDVCISIRKYLCLTVVMIVAVAGRLLMKRYCDIHGDNNAYLYVVIPLAYNAMAVWIFYTIDFLNRKLGIMDRLNATFAGRVIQELDTISFYVYITHYAFLDAPFNVMKLTGNTAVNLAVMLALTVACSYILKTTTKLVIKRLPRG